MSSPDSPADAVPNWLTEHREILCCPRCGGNLEPAGGDVTCTGCSARHPVRDGIPSLFCPNEWDEGRTDVTDAMRAFYEETPFPDYDEFDSVASLSAKARRGRFAQLLDDQVPPGARVLEAGCGTGQLTNFLSVANRTVFGADLCLNSLRLGERFRREQGLSRAHFLQMNLFRPAFRRASFDLVVSNGVLHHTSDPFLAFQRIAELVRPGGYVLIGLYHRYGRLVTDLRRGIFRVSGGRLAFLDPNLRAGGMAGPKRNAWYRDQYENPHESKHTIGQVLGWLDAVGFSFVTSLPPSRPFRPATANLFRPEPAGGRLERAIAELGMIRGGSREGGFFVVIGRRGDGAVPPAGD